MRGRVLEIHRWASWVRPRICAGVDGLASRIVRRAETGDAMTARASVATATALRRWMPMMVSAAPVPTMTSSTVPLRPPCSLSVDGNRDRHGLQASRGALDRRVGRDGPETLSVPCDKHGGARRCRRRGGIFPNRSPPEWGHGVGVPVPPRETGPWVFRQDTRVGKGIALERPAGPLTPLAPDRGPARSRWGVGGPPPQLPDLVTASIVKARQGHPGDEPAGVAQAAEGDRFGPGGPIIERVKAPADGRQPVRRRRPERLARTPLPVLRQTLRPRPVHEGQTRHAGGSNEPARAGRRKRRDHPAQHPCRGVGRHAAAPTSRTRPAPAAASTWAAGARQTSGPGSVRWTGGAPVDALPRGTASPSCRGRAETPAGRRRRRGPPIREIWPDSPISAEFCHHGALH